MELRTHVFVFDMPGCIDDYIHRIGRTARGMDGEAKLGVGSAAFSAFHTVDIQTFIHPVEVDLFSGYLIVFCTFPAGLLNFCPFSACTFQISTNI